MDSIMQDFNVTWNYVYTGTPIALKKKVNEQNFGSGLATRLTCIPLPTTHFEMMDLAEKYFDDKLRDAATNRRHHQRTIDEYNRLAEEFTIDDVANSFHININTARMRVKRLLKDGAVEKCGEYTENGTCKHRYRKKSLLVF